MAGRAPDDPAPDQTVTQTADEVLESRTSGQKKPNSRNTIGYYDFKSTGNADKWYQDFRTFCRPIEGHVQRSSNYIKVAVLDSGVDKSMLPPKFCESIKATKSFLPSPDDKEAVDVDENRHGTHVAALLSYLAPWAHIYIARIRKDDSSSMNPSCIAEAIRYSVEVWDVHIISMSWGFKNKHECISEAIRLAHDKDKIMFAAASNEGANLRAGLGVTFPANMQEVICINSSDGYGNKSDFNPPARKGDYNFLTRGEAVPVSHATGPGTAGTKLTRQTGTSFATPTAAAIAASLLEFVMQTKILRSGKGKELKQHATTKDGMTKLLIAIGSPVDLGFRYLRPWNMIYCKEIYYEGSSDPCKCTDCRKAAETIVRTVLEGPIPPLQDIVLFPNLQDDSLADAAFDARRKEHASSCLPNTRLSVLSKIQQWADGEDTRRVYWLKGMAGTGKSTIALTIARKYHERHRLGGSFFFSRGHGDLALARKFVTTIAYQLAGYSEELRMQIKNAVDSNPSIASKGLYQQWKTLVLEPLMLARVKMPQNSLLIVVDALDECEGEDDVHLLIRCLVAGSEYSSLQLRIFVTSRPDPPINIGFEHIPAEEHQTFVLHDIESQIVDQDLAIFYRHELAEIGRRFSLGDFWSEDIINNLVRQSRGLFIHATTVCLFIREGKHSGAEILSNLIKVEQLPPGPMQTLDKLYTRVLQSTVSAELDENEALGSHGPFESFRRIVGAIVVLFDTFSSTNLDMLLGEKSSVPILNDLRSVLNVPEQPTAPIGLLHPSFRDFLLDPSRCLDHRFFINRKNAHRNLLDSCLRVMKSGLKFNMCDLEKPGTRTHDIPRAYVDKRIPIPVQYACRYWAHHLQESNLDPRHHDGIQDFLQKRLIFWIETLAWTGQLAHGVNAVRFLQAIIQSKNTASAKITEKSQSRSFSSRLRDHFWKPKAEPSHPVLAMIHDARRFLLSHGAIIELAPLQIYSSALLFSPTGSVTRQHFDQFIPEWILQRPNVTNWGPHLQSMRHPDRVLSVAFSPDGTIVATAAGDIVRVWDATTGAERVQFKGHSRAVSALSFLPSGKMLATASHDGTARLWDTTTGTQRRVFKFGTVGDFVRLKMAFSFDGKLLAIARKGVGYAGHDDRSFIDVLDLDDGTTLQVFEQPETHIPCVAWSPVEKVIGLISVLESDCAAWLLDITTRRTPGWRQQGHMSKITNLGPFPEALAFSPDESLVAIAVGMNTEVKIYDVRTGKRKCTCKGHSDDLRAMAFSSDGELLATASDDKTARLWDTSNGNQEQIFEGHLGSVTGVSFSPDGSLIATASDDKTVRLWDIGPSIGQQTFERNLIPARAVTVSPGRNMVATASEDMIVQLWDAKTGMRLKKLYISRHFDLNALVFSPDGTLVAAGQKRVLSSDLSDNSEDNPYLWDTAKGDLLTFLPPVDTHSPLCFSPSGKMLAVAVSTGALLWGPQKGTRFQFLHDDRPTDNEGEYPVAFSFSPDEKVIAAVRSGFVSLWRIQSGDVLWRYQARRVQAVAFSSNPNIIAIGSTDGAVFLLDLKSRREIQYFEGHSSSVKALVFSPDGGLLASASEDMSVRVWNAVRGTSLQEFSLNIRLKDFSFSSCGKYLKTDRGALQAVPHITNPSPHLFVGDWIKEGDNDIVFVHPDFQTAIGFVAGQSVVFLCARGAELRLTLSSSEKSMLN